METITIHRLFKEKLGLQYLPVGIYFETSRPEEAVTFKHKGSGCIAGHIFQAAKGKTIAIDNETTGYPCSSFYLGYQKWIFPGIENFLSNGPFPERECERFIETPEIAKKFVESYVPETIVNDVYVFRPLTEKENREPEAVIFFVNPDQISALVYLAHYNRPDAENRVVTRFSSACMSMVTLPLQYARSNINMAFWGLHDISVRPSFPENIMTLSMPYAMYREMGSNIEGSFLVTIKWEKVLERITKK